MEEGVLVVENILSESQLQEARFGLHQTLLSHGIDPQDLAGTGNALRDLSSTNGSGGVLDLFYPEWKMQVASNKKLFHVTCQLWQAAYCHRGGSRDEMNDEEMWRWHPFGTFDCRKGYMYIDRIGYRIPTELARRLGAESSPMGVINNRSKRKPIQRSLTPHFDCCPQKLFSDTSKWRPIQCFVSLTDNVEPNTGGFEAAPGFHRDFDQWTRSRPPSTIVRKTESGEREEIQVPAPCIGEYTHVRPKEDKIVLDRVRHIPVSAGSAVFWDVRIPHANAYRHDGREARAVVYCSFLPDVELNRAYVKQQLLNYKEGRKPSDQWIKTQQEREDAGDDFKKSCAVTGSVQVDEFQYLSTLGKKLTGILEW